MNSNETVPHIVKRTALRAYPGWEIAHNETTGMYWANSLTTPAIGPGESTFADALYFVKHGEPPMHAN
jgi:hypothetical protein